MPSTIELTTGAHVWFDGEVWNVVEFVHGHAVLASGARRRSVGIDTLADQARVITSDTAADTVDHTNDNDLVPVMLGQLSTQQTAVLDERARHVREVLSDDGTALRHRLAAKARELQVSTRTLERWVAGYRDAGVAGLADSRLLGTYATRVDPRWDTACLAVLADYTTKSTPTMNTVLDKIRTLVIETHGPDTVAIPPRTTAYRRLKELSKGRHAFGSGKARRSVANRPKGPYGRLRATRPGEFVVLDTTPLDVFAMEPVTLRWVPVELTVAQDLFTRCILGLRLTPMGTRAGDVGNVLYQCVTPQPSGDDDGSWPFHGVPRNLLVGTEEPDGVSQDRVAGLPACLPEAIVVDHGKVYVSNHVMAVCARLGITVQPAIPYKPTDKPTVERFFKTLREGLLQHLPAYKGPNVFHRGQDVEDDAFFYVAELEQVIREWVGRVYHRTKHDGLCVPEIPGASFSPTEMFDLGLAKAGGLVLPSSPDLAYEFLEAHWRTIQHYGVEVNGQRFDGPGLNLFRNTRSPYGGAHAGKWPIFTDAHDARYAYFQHPEDKTWHQLVWEHAAGLDQPFSKDAVDYAKTIAVRENRHVDPAQAVQDLLTEWAEGQVTTRRDRSLAKRFATQRAHAHPDQPLTAAPDGAGEDAARSVASLPGVIDLLAARDRKAAALEVVDDIDVFERYYAEHPDSTGFEVFDE